MSREKKRKIMDEVRDYMRLHHYSIHTERVYCDWIGRFIRFHQMRSRDDFENGEEKIERFLTHLAVDGNVSPSTQNQAMNALVFLYRKVLKQDLDQKIDATRAKRRQNLPVVMTREEVAEVIGLMEGTPQLIVKMLYGSGLRVAEALRLRIHDIEFEMKTVTVRYPDDRVEDLVKASVASSASCALRGKMRFEKIREMIFQIIGKSGGGTLSA